MGLRRKLKNDNRKISALTKEQESLKKHLSSFGHDQIHYLKHGTMQGKHWENITIKKSLQLYLTCGTTGYETLRSQHYPLPCIGTLQKKIQNFKFKPGIFDELFPLLKIKSECMTLQERQAVLLIDEMALKPGLEYDNSIEEVIGMQIYLFIKYSFVIFTTPCCKQTNSARKK